MERSKTKFRFNLCKKEWILHLFMLLIVMCASPATLLANTEKGINDPSGQQQTTRTVEGVVTSEHGEALVGVSLRIEGTNTGTTTDLDGKYSLKVSSEDARITFSYIGYESQTILADRAVINVVLNEQSSMMDEVIVIGYGVMKKSDVTGAITSVKADAIARQPVANVANALQGNAPGVTVMSNSGSPSGSVNVRIRGIGTVNNSDPLYVVDGMPVTTIDFLSGGDIQSMEVLKDASATAIYGSRGANGVVLITTKQGKVGKPVITFDSYWGASTMLNKLDLMSGPEWYDLQAEINKVKEAEGATGLDLTKVSRETSTDWMKEISRSAFQQNYSLNVSGGAVDDYLYNFGVNYLDQDGTIKNTNYTRLSLRQNIEKTLVKNMLKLGTSINYSQSTAHKVLEGSNTVGIVNTAIKLEPVIPVYNQDGSYGSSPFVDYPNPVADINFTNNKDKISSLVGNIFAEFNPIKELTLKSSFGADIRKTDEHEFNPVYYVSSYQNNKVNKVRRGYIKRNYYVWENTISYLKTFDKHTINAVVGYSNEWGRTEHLEGTARGTASDIPELQYLDSSMEVGSEGTMGKAYENTMISYLGRLHYDFDDRYLVTFSFRRDGSSKFAKDHRWGNFPSVALGWKISSEPFFQKLDLNWVSSLKLRGGWGRIGNQQVDDYLYYNLLNNDIQYSYLYGMGSEQSLVRGLANVKLGNANMKWETTESTNIGLDANLLDGRLVFTGEYYHKKTKDMLVTEPMPNYMGYETGPMTNVGDVTNRGVEFSIDWRDKIGQVNYNIGFNISTIRNRVTSIGSGLPIAGGSIRNGNATITQVGLPVGSFYGYKTDGLIQTEEQLAEVRKRQANAELGDVVFVDTNGDGALDASDRTRIGKAIPDFTYGINIGANWNGFDINIQFGGSHGNDIFNAMRYFTYNLADATNKDRDLLNYWTPTNTNTNIPRLVNKDSNDNNRISDRYVEDGSYFRLRNLQIGYTLPTHITRKFFVEKLRIYFTGQNLFTITDYSGADPEIGQISSTNYLSRGVDIGSYPQARTFIGGINITF